MSKKTELEDLEYKINKIENELWKHQYPHGRVYVGRMACELYLNPGHAIMYEFRQKDILGIMTLCACDRFLYKYKYKICKYKEFPNYVVINIEAEGRLNDVTRIKKVDGDYLVNMTNDFKVLAIRLPKQENEFEVVEEGVVF